MNRILVIGIGSVIMMDDGIGSKVVGSVKSRLQEHGMDVLTGETDVEYCFNQIRPDDFLFIIDAAKQGEEPGSILILPLQGAAKSQYKPYMQHESSLLDAVSLKYPNMQGYLIGIEAAETGFGFELSNRLKDRFSKICDSVSDAIIALKKEASRT